MNCFVDYVWSPFVSCHLCLGMGLRMGRTLTHIEMEINPVDFGWLLKEHASLLHPCIHSLSFREYYRDITSIHVN